MSKLAFPVILEGNPPTRLFRDARGRLLIQVPGGANTSGWHSLLRLDPTTGDLEVAGVVSQGVDIDGTP